jgi:AcrR family transcriptional regulator
MARPASDIATRILRAARDRFLTEGVDGASLRKIAHDAGTNIGMVYYYFKTKDELFLAVVEETYVGVLADLEKALAEDVSPEQRLARVYQRVANMNDDELKLIRLLLREALVSSRRLEHIAERFRKGHLPLVAKTIAEGRSDGSFRTDLHPGVLFAATFSLGIMPQLVLRLLSASALPVAKLLPDARAAATMCSDVLLHGIGAQSPRPEGEKPGS